MPPRSLELWKPLELGTVPGHRRAGPLPNGCGRSGFPADQSLKRRGIDDRLFLAFPMIAGLDHVVVLVEDIKAGAAAYETLLGRAPSWQTAPMAPIVSFLRSRI